MRIVHLVNDLRDTGSGINNVAVDLAVEQRRLGHDVLLVATAGDADGLLERFGVDVVHIDYSRRRIGPLSKAQVSLIRAVRSFRPDVVHAHTITPTVLGRVATWGRSAVLVATVHNEFQPGVRFMRLADRVVGVSGAVSAAMQRRGVPAPRIRTVANGVIGTARRPALVREDAVTLPPNAIVTIGSVSHRKGADVLIEAFGLVRHAVPTAQLYFVGNLDWDHARQMVDAAAWRDAVHFVGFDPHPQTYLPNAAVFVLASRNDPMPLVILEALEVGAPVVASRVDGIPEALDEGRAGLLTNPGDPADLAQKLIRVLLDPGERAVLAQASAARGRAYTVAATTSAYLDVYRDALGRN